MDLGRDSLTWRHLGDARGALLAQRAGVLQAMHPAIAAALAEHSDVLDDPIGRLVRSAGPILGVVYDADPEATGAWVRDRHPRIRGRGYHALQPDTWFWAHATFFEAQIATQDLFGEPLTAADRGVLYAESIAWYARYGVSLRPVPPDYSAFRRYWDRMLETVLEPTPLAVAAARGALHQPRPVPVPAPLWPVLGPAATTLGPWLVRATLPPRARAVLGVAWRPRDAAAFAALQRAIRTAWPLVPAPARRLPRARAADARARRPSPRRGNPELR